MENDPVLWQTKLAARLHDPAEKALVLMRTSEGHEGGTSEVLREQLGLNALPAAIGEAVLKADRWASAADRAAFPNRNADGRYPAWQNVRFHENPVIIHPLTGESFDLGKLTDIQPEAMKALALDHFRGLIHDQDPRRTALAFWRFGPELEADEIKSLWALLPADTRVPDHTIFDHLDLTVALAGCFVLDAEDGPALLAVSLGPVQQFIAAARSTSDLWAGSHLLSRLSWEAMRVICEELGPEAILFPRLRGVPQVDVWLRDECGVNGALFEKCEWTRTGTDANPLFAAALPNRFTAIVPASRARDLAERVTTRVRAWILGQGEVAWRLLLKEAGIPDDPALPGYAQLREQLDGFPEVHWASVPWSLVEVDGDGLVDASSTRLAEAMQPFFVGNPPGYLGKRLWQLLSRGLTLDHGWFWRPNPGTLYPALHELLERVMAAGKSLRPFVQTEQAGWRDSLSGEAEWLTHDRALLVLPPGQREGTVWQRVAQRRPSWAKKGEHLSALNTLKRLWPTLFVAELRDSLALDASRFVVSTHTMALAGSLSLAVEKGLEVPGRLRSALDQDDYERVALPRKLAAVLGRQRDSALARLPGWLEARKASGDEHDADAADRLIKEYLQVAPEAYYALVLMDGDRMGAWLSADADLALSHEKSFHPQISTGLSVLRDDQGFRDYAGQLRAPSPSRHMAISEALNNFSLVMAPEVVERQFFGRVLYAGGDDLMAMLPVADLLPAMAALRAAYSGIDPEETGGIPGGGAIQSQANGFVRYRGRLLRMMGEKATASAGAVIAHHQAPLSAVLRELRVAEKRAKTEGGRNAFSLSVVKRSGGALYLTAKWGEPVYLLNRFRDFLAAPGVSRRAVYNSTEWLRDLPEPTGDAAMIARMLAYQFKRQSPGKAAWQAFDVPGLSARLVQQAMRAPVGERIKWLQNYLSVAEFLAREGRAGG